MGVVIVWVCACVLYIHAYEFVHANVHLLYFMRTMAEMILMHCSYVRMYVSIAALPLLAFTLIMC